MDKKTYERVKKIVEPGPARFRQGYEDGSGQDTVVDTVTGKAVAVTRWGCSCCEGDLTADQVQRAADIVKALNR